MSHLLCSKTMHKWIEGRIVRRFPVYGAAIIGLLLFLPPRGARADACCRKPLARLLFIADSSPKTEQSNSLMSLSQLIIAKVPPEAPLRHGHAQELFKRLGIDLKNLKVHAASNDDDGKFVRSIWILHYSGSSTDDTLVVTKKTTAKELRAANVRFLINPKT